MPLRGSQTKFPWKNLLRANLRSCIFQGIIRPRVSMSLDYVLWSIEMRLLVIHTIAPVV